MGALRGLLLALSTLVWILPPGRADDRCTRLRHLENGRTFFRYGGLYVTFTCNPGFKIHGYKTNSCVSGRWSRDPPICVASGCPDPGQPLYGSSALTVDRSFAVFACDQGYRLFGSPLLYCRGGAWNSTRPVCKESDVMASEKYKHLDLLRSKIGQNVRAPSALKNLLWVQYDHITSTISKDVFLKPEPLDKEPFGNSRHKPHLQGEALKELNRISVEKRTPVKHWSSQAIEAMMESRDSEKERSGYEQLVSTLVGPLLPSKLPETPGIKLLSTSSSGSSSSSTELPMTSNHGVELPQQKRILTPMMGLTVRRQDHTPEQGSPSHRVQVPASSLAQFETLVRGTKEPEDLTTKLDYSYPPSVHKQHVQTSTPEVSVCPTSSSSDQVPFLGASPTTAPLHQTYSVLKLTEDQDLTYQTQEIYPAASGLLDKISKSHAGSERSVASMKETSSGLEKLRPGTHTEEKIATNNSYAAVTLSDAPKGQNGTTAMSPKYLEGAKVSGYSTKDDSTVYPNNPGVQPTDLTFTSSSGLEAPRLNTLDVIAAFKPLIYRGGESTMSIITAGYDESSRREASSAETRKELQPGSKFLKTATSKTSKPCCLGSGQPTDEPTDAKLRHFIQDAVSDHSTVTAASSKFVTSQPSLSTNPMDQGDNGPRADFDAGYMQEYESSTSGWLGTQTSLTGSHQENKTRTFPDRRPYPVPVSTQQSLPPGGSHDLRQVGGAVSLWLHRQRATCPYPPLPAHGTFYFRTLENPAPLQYKHFVQYACYPGYTLAHGDIYSYCLQGGRWSGVTPVCIEETPCSLNNGGCSQVCNVDSQERAHCRCRSGFELLEDRRTCRDIDECTEATHDCQQTCLNTFGSFECRCGPGFLLSGDGRTCDDGNECAVGNGGCAHHCANAAGSFRCFCQAGFQLAHDLATCQDIDECLLPLSAASCLFGCINTEGSYRCHCPEGYRLVAADGHCVDIDECAQSSGGGLCAMECRNTPGSFRCSCSYGYVLAGDGRSCVAECPAGYRKHRDGNTGMGHCTDIDECQEVGLAQRRCEWKCVNLPGSHRCICPRGYRLDPDGHRCNDINECQSGNGGCSHTCINYKGGYKCVCPESHRFASFSRKKCRSIH